MEKPLSLKREDFLATLVKAVNDSGLPACVCLEVMRGMTDEVARLAASQLEKDKAAWEAAKKEEET